MGFAAGLGGRLFASLAGDEGIRGVWTWVKGEEREAIAMYDSDAAGRDATLISGPGPQVGEEDWRRLKADVLGQAGRASLVCFSGSLPPGSPLPAFTDLIRSLEAGQKPVWVDCQGDALRAALEAGPSGVKVNALEAGEITGLPTGDAASARLVARALCKLGAGKAIVTLGKAGAVLAAEGRAWQAAALPGGVPQFGGQRGCLYGRLAGLAGRRAALDHALRAATAAGAPNTFTRRRPLHPGGLLSGLAAGVRLPV
jgi:fructose-1-phosphate kinase PfkB-like protein